MNEIEDLENIEEEVEHDQDLAVILDLGHVHLVADRHFHLVWVDLEVPLQNEDLQDHLYLLEHEVVLQNVDQEVGVSQLVGKIKFSILFFFFYNI